MGELVRKLISEKLDGFSNDELKNMLVECLVDKSVEEFERILGGKNEQIAVYYLAKGCLFLAEVGSKEGYHLRFVKGIDEYLYTDWEENFEYPFIGEMPNAIFYSKYNKALDDACSKKILGYIYDFPHRNYSVCLAILRKFLPDVQMID